MHSQFKFPIVCVCVCASLSIECDVTHLSIYILNPIEIHGNEKHCMMKMTSGAIHRSRKLLIVKVRRSIKMVSVFALQ